MLEMVLMQVALLGMLDSIMSMIVGLIGFAWNVVCLPFYFGCELIDWSCMGLECSYGIVQWCIGCSMSILNMSLELCMSCIEPCLGCIPF